MNNRPNDPQNDKDNSPFANRNAQRFWLIIAGVVILLFIFAFAAPNNLSNRNSITLDRFAEYIKDNQVNEVTVRGGNDVIIDLKNGDTVTYYKERETDLFSALMTYGVTEAQFNRFTFAEQPGDNTSNVLFQLIIAVVPTLLIIWLLWRMMRSVRTGQDQALSFGRSRARVTRDMERPQVTFADVAGCEEAKEELKEVVEFLKEPEKFIRLGARIPKGVLMVGPPGTGKTLMARAVAGEAGVPFFSISGSEFVEMFVGVGASRVRDLFERAKSEAPAIIFVDEIDAVGRHRGAGLGGGHDEREQTLNQILVEMDGFETGTNVIVCAATNRPDILDPALLRPGRFDRKVIMDNPDIKGRQEILKVHTKGKPLAPDADIEQVAKMTVGFSGADLENLVNEAAILTARRNKKAIGMSEMSESMDRVTMGPERKSRVLSHQKKLTTAYHEAGHAILFHLLEHNDPVHKVTIVPRGRAGGYVLPLPDEDVSVQTKEWFEDTITAALGGRAAEEIVFNQFTTGASSDLEKVTYWARAMVTRYGMSEALGPRTFGTNNGAVFLGREIGEQRDYSEQAAEEIDNEVRRILQTAYNRAKTILSENRDKLDQLVTVLMEQETLDRGAFEDLMNGKQPPSSPTPPAQPPPAPNPSAPASSPGVRPDLPPSPQPAT
ncbi:MAG: ATP-dependent zinc metalloprotease FtsH [Anaerolineae bacterium]|nr:ATP-dependent zinc metalloprotease FtsH [Anaerolineae bacterium]